MLIILTGYLFLAALSLFYAWRYSKTDADPDWAMFNFEGFTGSWYGRDYVDCKSPGIHLWYWAITKVVGRNVKRVKFTHHLLVGLPSLAIFALLGFWQGAAYLVLVQSGFLLAFHGNVGQQPAAFIALGLLVKDPWLAVLFFALAVFFETKMLPSVIAIMALEGDWLQLIAVAIASAITMSVLYLFFRKLFHWLVEANITIPNRMHAARVKAHTVLFKDFTSQGFSYILPWIGLSIYLRPDYTYWLPPLIYVAVLLYGREIRPNHFLPLAGWIALPMTMPFVLIMGLSDFISGGFYMGNIWERFYRGLADWNISARKIGEKLEERPGTLWVTDLHSAVYVYAHKPIQYGLAEQIEIREVAKERREEMKKRWSENPPTYVVTGPMQNVKFEPGGYNQLYSDGFMSVYQKAGG